jgi:hypothetical protein
MVKTMRIGFGTLALAGALVGFGCAGSRERAPRVSGPSTNAATMATAPASGEFRVRIDEDLGPAGTRDAFSATLVDPIVDARGIVLAPTGARVEGVVLGVEADRIELSFDRVVEFDGTQRALVVTVVSALPHAVSVRAPDPSRESPTVVLQARGAPTAIGGGPREPDPTRSEALDRWSSRSTDERANDDRPNLRTSRDVETDDEGAPSDESGPAPGTLIPFGAVLELRLLKPLSR